VVQCQAMSRCLVAADLHSNAPAFEAVLADASRGRGFDELWVLGDIVGYGPHPEECIRLVQGYPHVCVGGNHDLGVLGRIDLRLFNSDAARACLWTRARLSTEAQAFLATLTLSLEQAPFLLVHGSPRDPVWEYVFSEREARDMAAHCDATHCLVGHTHRPAAFRMDACPTGSVRAVLDATVVELHEGRFIINPGAVGQPRDGDPRAAYAMLDREERTIVFRRVTYNVDGVVKAMLQGGLPEWLAARLRLGL
jgi:diadenosine tetraphosphatase ApaH/serine/threonine PP2A family protein phosphatase